MGLRERSTEIATNFMTSVYRWLDREYFRLYGHDRFQPDVVKATGAGSPRFHIVKQDEFPEELIQTPNSYKQYVIMTHMAQHPLSIYSYDYLMKCIVSRLRSNAVHNTLSHIRSIFVKLEPYLRKRRVTTHPIAYDAVQIVEEPISSQFTYTLHFLNDTSEQMISWVDKRVPYREEYLADKTKALLTTIYHQFKGTTMQFIDLKQYRSLRGMCNSADGREKVLNFLSKKEDDSPFVYRLLAAYRIDIKKGTIIQVPKYSLPPNNVGNRFDIIYDMPGDELCNVTIAYYANGTGPLMIPIYRDGEVVDNTHESIGADAIVNIANTINGIKELTPDQLAMMIQCLPADARQSIANTINRKCDKEEKE